MEKVQDLSIPNYVSWTLIEVIGAYSVVKGKVPSNTIWAGVPAKQICTLDEYYQRRKDKRVKDLVKRYQHVKSKRGAVTIESLGYFAYLFLERTESNFEKYIKPLEFNGKSNNKRNRDLFFSSSPLFTGYDDMVSYCENIKC